MCDGLPPPCLIQLRWEEMSNTTVVVCLSIASFACIGGAMGVESAIMAFYTIYNSYDSS